jgi:hypothetical protein
MGTLDAAYRRVLEECAALEDAVVTLEVGLYKLRVYGSGLRV